MGTWGRIKIKKADSDKEVFLVTNHDGFWEDSLFELLTLPFYLFQRAKDSHEFIRSNPKHSELNRSKSSFYFYDLFKGPKSLESYEELEKFWTAMIPLDVYPESLAAYLIAQSPNKWRQVPEFTNRWGALVSMELQSAKRLPSVTFKISDLDYLSEEEFDYTKNRIDSFVENHYSDLECWNPRISIEDDGIEVVTPLDKTVCSLIWKDRKEKTKT